MATITRTATGVLRTGVIAAAAATTTGTGRLGAGLGACGPGTESVRVDCAADREAAADGAIAPDVGASACCVDGNTTAGSLDEDTAGRGPDACGRPSPEGCIRCAAITTPAVAETQPQNA